MATNKSLTYQHVNSLLTLPPPFFLLPKSWTLVSVTPPGMYPQSQTYMSILSLFSSSISTYHLHTICLPFTCDCSPPTRRHKPVGCVLTMVPWKPRFPIAPILMDSNTYKNILDFWQRLRLVSFSVHVLQLKTGSAGMSQRVNILFILWTQNLVSSQFYGPSSTFFTPL